MTLLNFIKEHTPWPIRRASRRLKHRLWGLRDASRGTREVFTQIYAENRWGVGGTRSRGEYPFDSGAGSGDAAAAPYAECITQFIKNHAVRRVVDLGCGDFRVGRRIAGESIQYIGVDIVEPLIHANQSRFSSDRIDFRCLDIITDEIPDGDLCLIREVLQHLSNAQISSILARVRKFKWVIVTEAQPGPPGTFKPNRDKPHGGDSRALWNSGVVLSAPPFNVSRSELLLSVPSAAMIDNHRGQGRIETFLIEN